MAVQFDEPGAGAPVFPGDPIELKLSKQDPKIHGEILLVFNANVPENGKPPTSPLAQKTLEPDGEEGEETETEGTWTDTFMVPEDIQEGTYWFAAYHRKATEWRLSSKVLVEYELAT